MNDDDVLGPLTQQRIGTHQHFRWLKGIISAVLIFNLFDASMTMYAVLSGRATEANPLMAILIDEPLLFVTVKTALVVFGCWLLWRYRKRGAAVMSIFLAFLVYYMITIYHLHMLRLRVLDRVFELFY